MSFIDAFFMTVSSACQCGLTTVDPHDLKVGSMIVCVVMATGEPDNQSQESRLSLLQTLMCHSEDTVSHFWSLTGFLFSFP